MIDSSLTTADEQYAALRSGNGFAELPLWSSVTVTGADRQSFLHNFCTNDVKRLKPRESCEAFFTNVKGKILAHGVISCRDDELVVVGTPEQTERLIPHLDRYIIRENVTLADSTQERAYVLTTRPGEFAGAKSIRWELLGPIDCHLLEVNREALPQLRETLCKQGLTEAGDVAFDTLRIEMGTALFGDFGEANFPQEVGRDRQAISFTKGCYLGQETVARIDAMGHVNQQLVGIKLDGAAVPTGDRELFVSGAVVGHITSAQFSPQLKAPLALAMVRREHMAVGTRLDLRDGACEVVQLPLQ